MARQEQSLAAHVIAAKFAQRTSHEFRGHALSPGHVEIGVVQRFGYAGSECRRLRDRLLVERPARKRSRSFRGKERQARYRAHHNASFYDHAFRR